mgnify:CR=1 FL=1
MPPYSHTGTLEMTTADTTWLVDRMGMDTGPFQFLRELVMNSIEAILRTREKTGKILIRSEGYPREKPVGEQVAKMSVIDTGIGMNPIELVENINQLGKSGQEKDFDKNYGIGAKIACFRRNPYGVLYYSWRTKDAGYAIHHHYDQVSRKYGLRQFDVHGELNHVAPVADSFTPTEIAEAGHGTKVVLLGKNKDDNTMKAPDPGIGFQEFWIVRNLNHRWYQIPDGIQLFAEEEMSSKPHMHQVFGMKYVLEKNSVLSGVVELPYGKVHYWVLNEEFTDKSKKGGSEYSRFYSRGHIAVLYQNELYEFKTERAANVLLQQFGVIFGCRRTVLYLEPTNSKNGLLTTHSSRTQVLINELPLSWEEWASEFNKRMPSDLKTFIESQSRGHLSKDRENSIHNRLKAVLDLFDLHTHQISEIGENDVSEDGVNAQATKRKRHKPPPDLFWRDVPPIPPPRIIKPKSPIETQIAPGPLKANKALVDLAPKTRSWISVEDDDYADMQDRAARYLYESDTLLMNSDFGCILEMIDVLEEEVAGPPGTRAVIEHTVHIWVEQTLCETIIGAKRLFRSKMWNREELARGTCEEALTCTVTHTYHLYYSAKRELGSKLGKIGKAIKRAELEDDNEPQSHPVA